MLSFAVLVVTILMLPRQLMGVSQFSPNFLPTVLPLSVSDKQFSLFTWSSLANMTEVMAYEAFTFDLQEPAILQLIDLKHPGDQFQVFDNDQALGKTTFPKAMAVSKDEDNGSLYADSPALAMADKRERYSKGQTLLEPGPHTITIKVWPASPSIDVHGMDVSGGAIRLLQTPMRPQELYGRFDDDEEDDDDDDDENDDAYWDGQMETATVTVVVPPLTKDRWEHTEVKVMTVTDALGASAATYTPPAGRTELIRNPRCGMN